MSLWGCLFVFASGLDVAPSLPGREIQLTAVPDTFRSKRVFVVSSEGEHPLSQFSRDNKVTLAVADITNATAAYEDKSETIFISHAAAATGELTPAEYHELAHHEINVLEKKGEASPWHGELFSPQLATLGYEKYKISEYLAYERELQALASLDLPTSHADWLIRLMDIQDTLEKYSQLMQTASEVLQTMAKSWRSQDGKVRAKFNFQANRTLAELRSEDVLLKIPFMFKASEIEREQLNEKLYLQIGLLALQFKARYEKLQELLALSTECGRTPNLRAQDPGLARLLHELQF